MKLVSLTIPFLCAFFTLAAWAQEPQLRMKSDKGERFTYVCNSPAIAAKLAETLDRRNPNWSDREVDLQQQGACIGYGGNRVQVLAETSISVDDLTYEVAEVQVAGKSNPSGYVLKRNLIPVTDDDIQSTKDRSCGPGIYGEVDRLVEEPDGTLKKKRYLTISKCVNGQMHSFTKPLN